MAKHKFIAPKALGSESDKTWTRKNYTIAHSCGGLFGEGDTDSLYYGTFFGFPFITELCGVDGDWSVYQTVTPALQTVIDNIKENDGSLQMPWEEYSEEKEDTELSDLKPSAMPDDMKQALAIALLSHHTAAYYRWQKEEAGSNPLSGYGF